MLLSYRSGGCRGTTRNGKSLIKREDLTTNDRFLDLGRSLHHKVRMSIMAVKGSREGGLALAEVCLRTGVGAMRMMRRHLEAGM